MRYRNQLKEIRNWSYEEAGYRDDLPEDEKAIALEKAQELFEDALKELEEIEEEENQVYQKLEKRYKNNWDEAA